MNRVSSVNQPQNDRKLVVFCKRPARIELFRDEIFGSPQPGPAPTSRQIPSVDLTSQARGVCPPPDHTSIVCKFTVVHVQMYSCTSSSTVNCTRSSTSTSTCRVLPVLLAFACIGKHVGRCKTCHSWYCTTLYI